ncbi:MAG: GNAT family N-acetyltransferase [Acidimicrobiia bacterium]|nr:GNAT family N-acetyltransferase [Acidimicrobiia bacterium]
MTTTVANDPASGRYIAYVDGEPAGFAEYAHEGDVVTFTHTVVEDAFEGQGVGGVLARHALDDVRGRGQRVVARCPFIAGWIERNPDYADLLV